MYFLQARSVSEICQKTLATLRLLCGVKWRRTVPGNRRARKPLVPVRRKFRIVQVLRLYLEVVPAGLYPIDYLGFVG